MTAKANESKWDSAVWAEGAAGPGIGVGTETGELDRLLRDEQSLMPSSGFAAAVMEAISEEAAAPAPLPFPWKLAIPGIAALAVGVALLVWLAVKTFGAAAGAPRNGAPHVLAGRDVFVGWLGGHGAFDWTGVLRGPAGVALVALTAMLAAYLSVAAARRMAGQTQS